MYQMKHYLTSVTIRQSVTTLERQEIQNSQNDFEKEKRNWRTRISISKLKNCGTQDSVVPA